VPPVRVTVVVAAARVSGAERRTDDGSGGPAAIGVDGAWRQRRCPTLEVTAWLVADAILQAAEVWASRPSHRIVGGGDSWGWVRPCSPATWASPRCWTAALLDGG